MTTIHSAFLAPQHDAREAELQALISESLAHPAVRHPFLRSFATGSYPDGQAALRRYAVEYSGYAVWFPRYLTAVIQRLPKQSHRELLEHNLEEEQGNLGADDCAELLRVGIDPKTVLGVPHPMLFRRFCDAMGIDRAELAEPLPAARRWRARFLSYLQNATPAEAVGALGLGTEHIVRPVYQQLMKGILELGTLRRDQFVFFELHCLVDDQHQQDLLEIARDLASEPGGIEGLRRGMRAALEMRCTFWDHMHRAAAAARTNDRAIANPA